MARPPPPRAAHTACRTCPTRCECPPVCRSSSALQPIGRRCIAFALVPPCPAPPDGALHPCWSAGSAWRGWRSLARHGKKGGKWGVQRGSLARGGGKAWWPRPDPRPRVCLCAIPLAAGRSVPPTRAWVPPQTPLVDSRAHSRVRAASRHSVRPVGDRAARLGRGARRPRGGPTPRESGAAVTKTVAAAADPHFSLLRCCTVYPPVRHLGRTESAQRRLTRSCVVKSGRPPRQHVAAGGQLLAASMRRQTGTSCWWPSPHFLKMHKKYPQKCVLRHSGCGHHWMLKYHAKGHHLGHMMRPSQKPPALLFATEVFISCAHMFVRPATCSLLLFVGGLHIKPKYML